MFRGILAIAFAAYLLAIVFGFHSGRAGNPTQAMWDVAFIGFLALLYTAANGFNALRHSLDDSPRVAYLGLIFAFLPLLVAVYSVAVWQYSPNKLSQFQIIAVLFGALASLIDVTLFSWLTFGHVRAMAKRAR